METAIAALIVLTVVLFGALTIVQGYLSSQDAIMTSWREMEERLGERARTKISVDGPGTVVDSPGHTVVVTLTNEGSTKLADFDQWDVIVQYDSDGNNVVKWLSYVKGGPGWRSDEWSEGIEDVFEPDIFDPGETMVITMSVSSEITPTGQAGRAIIATPNGVSDEREFQ